VTDSLLESIRKTISESAFLATLAMLRVDGGHQFALGNSQVRPLEPTEIEGLRSAGCSASSWSQILVAEDFDWRRVERVRFLENVVLGRFRGNTIVALGLEQPTGVYDSVLAHCVIGHDALVERVGLMSRVVVGQRAIVWNCGRVVCRGATTFGSDTMITVGPQSGGRRVPLYAEIDVPGAAALATCKNTDQLGAYEAIRLDYRIRARFDRTILCADSRLLQVDTVTDAFVGVGSLVDGCRLLAESTLLSSVEEPVRILGAQSVQNSVLQWGSSVESGGTVQSALLAEHSCVQDQGSLRNSLLGPNSVVGRGEVDACLLGPFVALHHQSMLISTVWPEGKGNISSGANVGANHTGRAPDQEFWPGEGMFIGLGVNVRFPADFTMAPYSVLACSVTTSPQRVEFPFSLINSPTHSFPHLPPTLNQIVPAWLLTDTLYTLVRNERKYRQRNKARRLAFDGRILRPEIHELIRDACRRLESVDTQKAVYTEKDIPGLGKNYLLEEVRGAALRGYRWFLRLDGLRSLHQHVAALLPHDPVRARGALKESSGDAGWEGQRRWLAERERFSDVVSALTELTLMLDLFARDVERSKAKDDQRGARIRSDYASVHQAAADDPVIQETWREIRQEKAEIEKTREQLAKRNG
jgi:hypothetical protein